MAASFFWGLLAGSSLVIGGLLALLLPIPRRVLGLVMAFGAGVLISAVAFELVEEAFATGGGKGRVAFGLLVGSLVFFLGDLLIDRFGARIASTPAGARPRAPRLRSRSASCSMGSPSHWSSV